jgi:hypothetical protein
MGLSTAERHSYVEAELSSVGQTILGQLDASPGPWWGFNGVNTLVVTQNRLWEVRSRLFDQPVMRGVNLTEVDLVSVRQRRPMAVGKRGPVTLIRLRRGGRNRRFAAEDTVAASRFVSALRQQLESTRP